MRAAYYETTGPASEVLHVGDITAPEPGPGEVLVRIHVSGVNPSDVKKRQGLMPAPTAFPRIVPHSDGAGVIEAVGAGVPPDRIGQRVWLWNAQWGRASGTAAELCALPAAQAVDLPEAAGFAEGACLGIPAQTAWVATTEGRPGPGRTVLVHGGAGAVGEMAVALAADAGAHVLATVSGDVKAAIARRAGAAEVINYRETDVVDAVLGLTDGRGVDHIVDVDFGANHAIDAAIIAINGSIAAYSAPSRPAFEMSYYAFAARACRLRFVQVYLLDEAERARATAGVNDLLGRSVIRPRIARSFPLERIAEAHETQESGTLTGNIILDLTGENNADT